MDDNVKKIIFLVGLVTIIFFLIRYVLPLLIKILGIFVAVMIYALVIGISVIAVIYLVGFFLKKFNGE